MNQDLNNIWQSTPLASERVIQAIYRIASTLRAGTWQFATAQGLYPIQVDVLDLLASRNAAVRLSWVAQQLGISTASASDSITALVTKGLVEKCKALDDGRAVALTLTDSGRELAAQISGTLDFAHEAVEGLPAAEQQALFSSLLNLIGQLQCSKRFPELRTCVTCHYFWPNAYPDEEAALHHCRLVNAPLPTALLRLDCPEHVATDGVSSLANWQKIGTR